ncbi:MAG: hypothetical protein HC895_21275 [Leptolyngbyaceae cyanobacterium SM1_3_5]|nr:hypothetical protein [Leptolyngbyaceae cyanobacterium SM1_3_5]
MKRLILAGLFTLGLTGFAPKANAQPNPFDLVNLARNGYFQEQGIPSHGNLTFAVGTGRVTAEQIVQAAIAETRLSPDRLTDSRYLEMVEAQLEDLHRN